MSADTYAIQGITPRICNLKKNTDSWVKKSG